MKKQLKQPKQETWLYHLGLVDSRRGYTGNYRPAGLDTNGVPQIELEVVYKKGEEPFVVLDNLV